MTETAITPAANGELFKALAQLQAKLPKIRKGETAKVRSDKGNYEYKYADLTDVSEELLPLMGSLGLKAFTSRPTSPLIDGHFALAYSLVHVSGEREDGLYPLPSNGTPQAIGSAITYARRYCLCAVTGVAPGGDDDDAGAAETNHRMSAGDVWENAAPASPRQSGSKQQRGQDPRPAQSVKPADTADPDEIDIDAQAFADEAHGALSLNEMEDITRRSREAGKLSALVRNPSSDGTGKPGKLAVYLDWKRKQIKETDDALKELTTAASETGFPVEEIETHVKAVTGTDLEVANVAQIRHATQALRTMQEQPHERFPTECRAAVGRCPPCPRGTHQQRRHVQQAAAGTWPDGPPPGG